MGTQSPMCLQCGAQPFPSAPGAAASSSAVDPAAFAGFGAGWGGGPAAGETGGGGAASVNSGLEDFNAILALSRLVCRCGDRPLGVFKL